MGYMRRSLWSIRILGRGEKEMHSNVQSSLVDRDNCAPFVSSSYSQFPQSSSSEGATESTVSKTLTPMASSSSPDKQTPASTSLATSIIDDPSDISAKE